MIENVPMQSSFKVSFETNDEEQKRSAANMRFNAAGGALFQFGTADDIEYAAKAIAKIAAKAMRRRA